MKTLTTIALLLVALALPPSPARAVLHTIDDVPAATLLLPYFEVDPNGTSASGVTTIFTVSNANAAAVLTHVVLWTDYGIPLFSFDLYLTGYDTETIDLQQVFAGNLPRTGSAGQDPEDAVSPQGPLSQDVNYASCSGILPFDPLPADLVAALRAEFSGRPSERLGGKCAGRDVGDGLLRGYVTVDTVDSCTLLLPNSPGYLGVTTTAQNYLWGDWRLLDRGTRKVLASKLVAVEAGPAMFVPGDYTFYGRYVAWAALDAREPLANVWATRFANTTANVFPARTSLIVWRDHKSNQLAVDCDAKPAWFPLSQEQIVIFDDEENVDQPGPFDPIVVPFQVATQRVVVGGADLPAAFDRGWLYLNLNTFVVPAGPNPPGNPAAAQAWVEVIHEEPDVGAYGVRGRAATMHPATQLGNAGD